MKNLEIIKNFKKASKELNIDYNECLEKIITQYINTDPVFKTYFEKKEEIIKTIIKSYTKDYKSILTIQKELGLSQKYVTTILNKNKVLKNTRKKTALFNIHYFEKIDSSEKAYFLGLLLADGNVNEKRKSVRIGLQEEDSYILEKFKKAISSNNEVYFCHKPLSYPNRKHKKVFEVTSEKFYNDLTNLGIVPRKSLIVKYPVINSFFEKDLIRGILDGDGCIYISKNKKKYDQCRISWLGTYDVCNGILKYFKQHDIKLFINKKENIYSVGTSKKSDIIKICNILYNNTDLYLKRKFDKFILIKNSLKDYDQDKIIHLKN